MEHVNNCEELLAAVKDWGEENAEKVYAGGTYDNSHDFDKTYQVVYSFANSAIIKNTSDTYYRLVFKENFGKHIDQAFLDRYIQYFNDYVIIHNYEGEVILYNLRIAKRCGFYYNPKAPAGEELKPDEYGNCYIVHGKSTHVTIIKNQNDEYEASIVKPHGRKKLGSAPRDDILTRCGNTIHTLNAQMDATKAKKDTYYTALAELRPVSDAAFETFMKECDAGFMKRDQLIVLLDNEKKYLDEMESSCTQIQNRIDHYEHWSEVHGKAIAPLINSFEDVLDDLESASDYEKANLQDTYTIVQCELALEKTLLSSLWSIKSEADKELKLKQRALWKAKVRYDNLQIEYLGVENLNDEETDPLSDLFGDYLDGILTYEALIHELDRKLAVSAVELLVYNHIKTVLLSE